MLAGIRHPDHCDTGEAHQTIELASQLAAGHLFVINPGTDNYAIMKIVKESNISSSIQNLFSKQVFSMISSLNLRCPRKSWNKIHSEQLS